MMRTRPLIAALAVLALLGAAAPLASTQAAEIGEGVEIRPVDGPNGAYAQVGDDGQVSIQLDADASVPGEGLPADTELDFDRVFLVVNANDAGDAEGRQAYVYVRDDGAGADNVSFYRGGDTGNSIEGEDNAVRLDTGESTDVGFTVDTDDEDAVESGDLTVTVEAAVSQLADAALDVVPERPTAGEAVTFDASGSVGDDLAYEYDFDDGTIAADAGPTQEHVFDDPGTYNVTLTVDETAARAPNGSDSVSRKIVVRGPPQTAGSGETVTLPNAVPGSGQPGVRSVTADLAGGASDDVTVRALATESVADAAGGNAPQGSTVVGAADVSVPTNPDVDATITVEIDTSAVPAGTPASDLALERYNGTAWEALPTAVESTGGGTITLVAETPGFSPFAATVNPGAPTLDLGGGGGGGGGGADDADDTDDVDGDTPVPDESDDSDDPADTATPPATAPPTETPPSGTATPAPADTPPGDTPADVAEPTTVVEPGGFDLEPGGFDLGTVLVAVALLVVAGAALLVRYRDGGE
jgi:plastocyanin